MRNTLPENDSVLFEHLPASLLFTPFE